MIDITLPDGSVRNVDANTTSMDIALSISEGLARNVLSAVVNGDVVDQCIKPDIGHIIRIKRKWNSPFQSFLRTRNTQIVDRLLQELEDLLSPKTRKDERLVRFDMIDQPVLVTA